VLFKPGNFREKIIIAFLLSSFFMVAAPLRVRVHSVSISGAEKEWKEYPYLAAGNLLEFPADEGRHDDAQMEWWYFNLHLTGKKTGKSYGLWAGYYFTYNTRFIAFADNTNGTFTSEIMPGVMSAEKGRQGLEYKGKYFPDEWYQIEGKPFTYILKVYFKDIEVDLSMDLRKPPLILNNNGLIHLNPAEFTYYYSLSNMKVEGTIKVEDRVEEVEGIGWEDHQWGNFSLQAISMGIGHEWFSIQVDTEDGRNPIEMVFYQIFTPEYKIIAPIFSLINAEHSLFSTKEFTIERLAYWESPEGEYYSNKWRIIEDVNQIDLIITPYEDNQLLYPPFFPPFREGPCYVEGKIKGKLYKGTAYAEAFKRYKPPLIEIKFPNGGEDLTGKVKVSWLRSEDEAMSLRYSLYYSQDGGKTFIPLAFDITEREFIWDTSSVPDGDKYLIKVSASTPDNLLSGSDTSDKVFTIKK